MKASFDVTLSQKDLYRFNMYQTYTGFQGWTSIVLGILGFVMAGISFQNGKISYTLLYTAVGFCSFFIFRLHCGFGQKKY